MIRTAFLVAALAMTAPAFAQTHVPAGHGATAGRSPHQAYRPANVTASCKAMHSLPAGKLPVYGRHALPNADCVAAQVASADGVPTRTHAD